MSFKKEQIRELVTDTLKKADWYSPSAVELILGTIAQESANGTYLEQLGSGPAKGVIQMEPFTEQDCWDNYLEYKQDKMDKVILVSGVSGPNAFHLRGNLIYQILMCRIKYMRDSQAIPAHDDIPSLARYWKRVYNSAQGKGTVKEFIMNYNKYVQ